MSDVDIANFADRVERLCVFLMEGCTYSDDREAVRKLRDEAADLMSGVRKSPDAAIRGIAEVLR